MKKDFKKYDSNSLKCEFCKVSHDDVDLYEGWFYTNQKLNPYAEGTASAGLMQLRIACMDCVKEAKEKGLRP